MLQQAKTEVNYIRKKSTMNLAGMLLSLAALSALLFLYDFNSWTAMFGIGIIVCTVAVYTFLLYREHLILSSQDFTIAPATFIERLRKYQLSRYQLHTRLYWFYPVVVTIGMLLYFAETLKHLDIWVQLTIFLFSMGWMVFCATILRKSFLKREKERLDTLIAKLEKISGQLH